MISLQSKIQNSLVGSIIGIAVVAIVILWINQLNSLHNKKIIDTMTMEYSIISLSEELAQSYNATVKNSGDAAYIRRYEETRGKLLDTLSQLRVRITQPESRTLLVGIDHTVREIMKQCDTGLSEMKNGNYTNLSDYYARANKYNEFINENTKTLLGKELNFLYTTQKQSERAYNILMITTFGIFIGIAGIMIIVARNFSNQLVTPLAQLSVFAKEVANKNLQAARNKSLKITEDEIGSLTKSIYTMVDTLVAMLNNEQQTGEKMKKINSTIAKNNEELQQMNNVMIGRELRMVELKKEIEDLKSKFDSQKQ